MTRGLLHQQPGLGYSTPRSATSPQHGQKSNPKAVEKSVDPAREPRTIAPRHISQQQ